MQIYWGMFNNIKNILNTLFDINSNDIKQRLMFPSLIYKIEYYFDGWVEFIFILSSSFISLKWWWLDKLRSLWSRECFKTPYK